MLLSLLLLKFLVAQCLGDGLGYVKIFRWGKSSDYFPIQKGGWISGQSAKTEFIFRRRIEIGIKQGSPDYASGSGSEVLTTVQITKHKSFVIFFRNLSRDRMMYLHLLNLLNFLISWRRAIVRVSSYRCKNPPSIWPFMPFSLLCMGLLQVHTVMRNVTGCLMGLNVKKYALPRTAMRWKFQSRLVPDDIIV